MTKQRNPDETPVAPEQPVMLNRRRALKTLGLAASTAYMAPILLSLNEVSAKDDKDKDDKDKDDKDKDKDKDKRSKPSRS